MQAIPQGVEGVARPVVCNLRGDMVQVPRGVRVVADEGGDVLYQPARTARIRLCITLAGVRVLRQQWGTAARRSRWLCCRQ